MCRGCTGWDTNEVTKKDFNRGAVEVSDFDDEFRHVKVSGKKEPRKKKGCPDNDNKAHVYVWVTEKRYRYKWDRERGYLVEDRSRPPYEVKRKTCCGCLKVAKSVYDWTEYYG